MSAPCDCILNSENQRFVVLSIKYAVNHDVVNASLEGSTVPSFFPAKILSRSQCSQSASSNYALRQSSRSETCRHSTLSHRPFAIPPALHHLFFTHHSKNPCLTIFHVCSAEKSALIKMLCEPNSNCPAMPPLTT